MTPGEYMRNIESLRIQFKMIGVTNAQFEWAINKAFEYAITTAQPNRTVVINKLRWLHEQIVLGTIKVDNDWSETNPLLLASQTE